MTFAVKADYPIYVVVRDGRYLQERAVVEGFHWQTSAVAWFRDARDATKYPKTIARLIALERGGEAVEWRRRPDNPWLSSPAALSVGRRGSTARSIKR